jgi:hypothetical protein
MANNQNRLKLGTWNAICDICGFKCKADDMLLRWDGFMVDRKCWEPRQPQDFLRSVREYSNPPPWTRPDTPPETSQNNNGLYVDTGYWLRDETQIGINQFYEFDYTNPPPAPAYYVPGYAVFGYVVGN